MRIKSGIALLVIASVVAVMSALAVGSRARKLNPVPAAQAPAPQAGGWRQTSLKALTLVSAEPVPDHPDVTVYRLRNDSGRGIAGFVLAHDAGENAPSHHEFFTRLHVKNLNPIPLPPGGIEEIMQESALVERLTAVMYDDASVEGEATSVDVLKSNVKNFEDGLAQELAALNASSNSKGVERAAAELAARVEEGDPILDAGGRARGVIANKS
ncbi:MAG TPA: hypothetical protein VE713_08845, partial [Pyrinomonadaceae bacterium]|nr:hypothetical protein [Pyrinomonadaceae bacterium]